FTLSLSCSADSLVLHSFPTRRSSDLGFSARATGWIAFRGVSTRRVKPNQLAVAIGLVVALVTVVSGVAATVLQWHDDSEVTREVDRKSTRLNSSHVKISYAVFCLKKK